MGNQQVIEERSDISIPKNLIQKYIPPKYSYIRFLSYYDQNIFSNIYGLELPNQLQINTWIDVMERSQIYFECRYNVFRKSYWCESSGSSRFTERKTNYHSLCRIFNRDGNTMKNLLIDSDNITVIDCLNIASWVNPKIGLPNTYLI